MRLVRSILTEAFFRGSPVCVDRCIDPDCCPEAIVNIFLLSK